jgi:tripartite-type tricarboxylate transporter receptor subunit TctC
MRLFLKHAKWFAALIGLVLPLTVLPQAFPSKPMRIVVPFPPGALLDMMARMVSQKMSESVGQPVIVENRAGANGMIGSDHVAKSAPDGYTILCTTPSTHVSAVFLSKTMPYDPRKDVTPITAAVDTVVVLGVNPSLPVNSPRELVEHAKRYPGKLTYGTAGVGNAFHLIGEMFQMTQGVKLVHVPYKGIVQAVQEVATGQVDMAFASITTVTPHLKSGRVKVLAVLNPQRYAGLPDIPTTAETLAGFVRPDAWFGFLGPANMPAPILARVNAEIVKAVKMPDLLPKFDSMGVIVIGNSPQEFSKMYMAGFDLYGKIIKAAGIQPE